jgi:hypothetical protein
MMRPSNSLRLAAGKVYEAFVLSLVVERLAVDERLDLFLVGGQYVELKSGTGPINLKYPRIKAFRNGKHFADIWTDVAFKALSCYREGREVVYGTGDCHELDIVVVAPNSEGYPNPDQIWLGVECKDTGYTKNLLREILGVRRELSLLQDATATKFNRWPATSVPARPPSCVLVYSTSEKILNYSSPGETFGIQFHHVPVV